MRITLIMSMGFVEFNQPLFTLSFEFLGHIFNSSFQHNLTNHVSTLCQQKIVVAVVVLVASLLFSVCLFPQQCSKVPDPSVRRLILG